MTRQSLWMAIGSVLLIVYLCVALGWASSQARSQRCAGLYSGRVIVDDVSGRGFVTPDEVTRELGSLPARMQSMRLAHINLDSLQRHLSALDKLERVTVNRMSDHTVRVVVTPMEPVARLWDSHGHSKYVNRSGKTMLAEARYRVDVPHVTMGSGSAMGPDPVKRLLPLLDFLADHQEWNALVSMLSMVDTANVIMHPVMRGHVVNLGAPDSPDMADKFHRLSRFYSEVLPRKGWEFYDTISVKWDGQVVATRRKGKLPPPAVDVIDELENEGDDLGTMLTTDAAAEAASADSTATTPQPSSPSSSNTDKSKPKNKKP